MPFYEKRRVQIYSEEVGCGLLLLLKPRRPTDDPPCPMLLDISSISSP